MNQPFPEQVSPGGILVYPQIQSPNFVPGTAGWQIARNGDAQFNQLVITNGLNLLYSPSAAAGNLVASSAATAGTDRYGNAYLAGDTTYVKSLSGGPVYFAIQSFNGSVSVYTAATEAGPWTEYAGVGAFPPGGHLPLPVENPIALWAQGGILITDNNGNELIATVFPSGDTTGVTDVLNIGQAWTSGYQEVHLTAGIYYLSGPLSIPDQHSLAGANPSWGIPTGNYGAGGLPLQGTIIKAGSSFSGAALLTMGSAGNVQHGGQRIYSVTLDGTGAPAGTHGIASVGFVGGVKMRDVVAWSMPGDGMHIDWDGTSGHTADFWQVDSCKFSHCGGYGVYARALSDSWFIISEATGNTTGGWFIIDGADSRYIGCRGSSNAGVNGWTLNTLGGFTSIVSFIGCEANLNGTGIAVTGTGSTGTYLLDSFRVSGNTTSWSYGAGSAMVIESNAAWNTSTATPTFA